MNKATGDVYFTSVSGITNLIFDTVTPIYNLTAGTTYYGKINSAGTTQWIQTITNTNGTNSSGKSDIKVDTNGDVYLAGISQGNVITPIAFNEAVSGQPNVFVAKILASSTNGVPVWATAITAGIYANLSAFGNYAYNGSATNNYVRVEGFNAQSPVNYFGRYIDKTTGGINTGGVSNSTSDKSEDMVSKNDKRYSATTNNTGTTKYASIDKWYFAFSNVLSSSNTIQSPNNLSNIRISVADNEDYYVSGNFRGSITVGSPALSITGGTNDIFIAKFSGATNNIISLKKASSSTTLKNTGLAVNGNGNLIVAGYFIGSATFGTKTITAHNGCGGGATQTDMFVWMFPF